MMLVQDYSVCVYVCDYDVGLFEDVPVEIER